MWVPLEEQLVEQVLEDAHDVPFTMSSSSRSSRFLIIRIIGDIIQLIGDQDPMLSPTPAAGRRS